MACTPCAAAAARRKGTNVEYVWTSSDGQTVIVYPWNQETVAKAKVMRKGGHYVIREKQT